jgi:spore maturation protein CgeB
MRLARITTLSPEYIRYFYRKNRRLRRGSYQAQLEALFWDSYAQSDNYTFHLKELGYECIEVVANVERLQRSWSEENGFRWDTEDFIHTVTMEQVRRFKPEVVFVNNFRVFDDRWLACLRSQCPSIRLVLGWCGVGIESCDELLGFDFVLTCSQHLAQEMRKGGLRVEVVPFGFDQRILERIDCSLPATIDLSFAGTVRRSDSFHSDRAQLLERISKEFELTVFTDSRTPSKIEIYGRQVLFETARWAGQMGLETLCRLPGLRNATKWSKRPKVVQESRLWRHARPGVYGLDYYQALHDSKVTVNVHPNCAGATASNIRLFEATGVGTCLVTDWKSDLGSFFEVDREVVTFKSSEECVQKLRWLRSNPEAAGAIAAAGKRRTHREHTYGRAAASLDRLIKIKRN